MSSLPAALLANGLLAVLGYLAGAIDAAGAGLGIILGATCQVAFGPAALALVVWFVVGGSLLTRLGYHRKTVRGAAQERGGRRGWPNAAANLGVPAGAALLALGGVAGPWAVAFVGAVAAAAADTTESEVGTAFASRAWLPGSWRTVEPGTEGAVSLLGTAAGAVTAMLTAGLAAWLGLVPLVLAVPVAAAALLATLLESWLGATHDWSNELLNTITGLGGAGGAALAVLLLG